MNNELLRVDLKNIRSWIFDLDDTLYPSTEGLFSQMADRIQSFIMDALHVNGEDASEIQKKYYKKYGATVRGLMLEHNIRPEDFTDYVHDLDLSCLKKNKPLRAAVSALPGRRFVFTNGAYHHAERVLKCIGLEDCFDGIFSIREAGYIPKPAKETYLKMLETFGISPESAVMFDDSQTNLLTAHKIGMKTVWISTNIRDNVYNMISKTPDFCDYQTDDLVSFLSSLILEKTA